MPARSLLLAAFVLVAARPVQAQDFVWTLDRPDAVAPVGVFADRTLPRGSVDFSVQYKRLSQDGIRFGTELVDPLGLFEIWEIVPLSMTTDGYFVSAAVGLNEDVTLAARGGFLQRARQQFTEDFTFFRLEADGLSDLDVHALVNIWTRNAIRAHLHAGLTIPTGRVDAAGGFGDVRTRGTLPYDMQLGAGAWGFSPGVTAQIMNESGTVGGQVVATRFFAERRGWRAGDRVEANAWAAYRLSRFFSASARVHALGFEAIEGFDPDLDPLRDPGEFPLGHAGRRITIPLGLNFYMAEGAWQGHRLSVEFVFHPAHERFDGYWLATDHAVLVGWQFTF